jgi:hypothetical protein
MNIEKVDVYNDNPKDGVNNEYPTPKYSFRQPCLTNDSRRSLIQGNRI